ncbi:MAG TPA: hypothetical protein VFV29_02875 [Actinomycetota bacterium]|nr:hypothetical protein [Actinomycetota bacterium]
MHAILATVATGHPAIPTGGDFDFTPLLYCAILILGFRKLRPGVLLLATPLFLLAGGVVDSISDAVGLSTLTTASALAVPALLLPLPRPLRHHRPSAG